MSHEEVRQSLDLLEKDWDVDPVLRKFILGEADDVSDRVKVVGSVTFHIPYIGGSGYILWKCHWPDCHNCCERQGRLPLTSDDLVTIGKGLKYSRTSDFVRNETVMTTYGEPGPSGEPVTMTTVNLKRSPDETEADDGTRIPCRFLDGEGGCSMHPDRPGVCYMYPFSSWLANSGGMIRVHASYQFTGDCPGFYVSDSLEPMRDQLEEYSRIIHRYAMATSRTGRDCLGSVVL